MIKLEVSAFESHSAQVYSISQARTTIGRNPTNDIVVDSQNVSGAHAEIVRTDEGGLRIRDLGSINGTFVNGEQITDSPIEPADKLRFGNIEGNLTESAEAQPIAFGSLAISQAKQAMEKLNRELPSGPGEIAEPELGDHSEAAAAESPPPDPAAPDGQTEALLDEPAPVESADSEPADADGELAASAAEMELLRARIAELEMESADGDPEDAGAELAASVVELESLRTLISEFEKDRSDLVLANETLTGTLAEKSEAITELSGQLQKKDEALADQQREKAELGAKLEAKCAQAEQSAAEKTEGAEAETAALRAEVAALKEAHGEVAQACAELGAVQQEIESLGPQRAGLQQELNNFLAEAEVTRAAAIEENAEVRRVLKDSRKELETLNQTVNEAEQQEDLRRETVAAGIRELEERRQSEADGLTGLEAQMSAAEDRLEEITVSTREMESKRDRLDTEVAKTEKILRKIQGKIGRRKKLLERLKKVARREREVARKMKEGKRFLDAAESQKAAQDLPTVQPWDVDRARADRDRAMEEARKIQQKVDRMKAELLDRQRELKEVEAGILQTESTNPFYSEPPDEADQESGAPSRLTAQLP